MGPAMRLPAVGAHDVSADALSQASAGTWGDKEWDGGVRAAICHQRANLKGIENNGCLLSNNCKKKQRSKFLGISSTDFGPAQMAFHSPCRINQVQKISNQSALLISAF